MVDGCLAAFLVVEPVGILNERLSVGGRFVSGWNGIAGDVREESVSVEVGRPLSLAVVPGFVRQFAVKRRGH